MHSAATVCPVIIIKHTDYEMNKTIIISLTSATIANSLEAIKCTVYFFNSSAPLSRLSWLSGGGIIDIKIKTDDADTDSDIKWLSC